jgi:fatty acid amide hydrolase 2
VTVVEGTSRRPLAPELQDARARAAGALASAGARVRTVSIPGWRDSLLPYLTMLQADEASDWRPTHALLESAGSPAGLRDVLRGTGAHTLPTRLTLAAEQLGRIASSRAARERMVAKGRALARDVVEAIGDGVLLHPAHPTLAPRHRRTYGRPWVMMPAAIFNLAGVPVTEVPLGLSAQGLPIGIQVAAAPGADHLAVAIAIELEAVFGGWVAPPGI